MQFVIIEDPKDPLSSLNYFPLRTNSQSLKLRYVVTCFAVKYPLLVICYSEFLLPQKAAYESHIPKGILKRYWMHKHLTQIPAVVVIFFDLDWDDPQWEEKKIECVSRVQSIR